MKFKLGSVGEGAVVGRCVRAQTGVSDSEWSGNALIMVGVVRVCVCAHAWMELQSDT